MKSQQARNKMPQGFRKSLGFAVSWILRKECMLLTRKGLSASIAKKIVVIFNLFIIISLLFIAFPMWMAFVTIICGGLLLAGADIDIFSPLEYEEWRDGIDGYGIYDNQFDIRVDGGHANDDDSVNR